MHGVYRSFTLFVTSALTAARELARSLHACRCRLTSPQAGGLAGSRGAGVERAPTRPTAQGRRAGGHTRRAGSRADRPPTRPQAHGPEPGAHEPTAPSPEPVSSRPLQEACQLFHVEQRARACMLTIVTVLEQCASWHDPCMSLKLKAFLCDGQILFRARDRGGPNKKRPPRKKSPASHLQLLHTVKAQRRDAKRTDRPSSRSLTS